MLSPPIPQRLSESKLHRVTDEEDNLDDNLVEVKPEDSFDATKNKIRLSYGRVKERSGFVTIDYSNGSNSRFPK